MKLKQEKTEYDRTIEENEHLEHAYYAPLSVENCPDAAFKCSSEVGCGEMLVWNKKTSKLQCWNTECELYSGE